jgi:hypothetical protein
MLALRALLFLLSALRLALHVLLVLAHLVRHLLTHRALLLLRGARSLLLVASRPLFPARGCIGALPAAGGAPDSSWLKRASCSWRMALVQLLARGALLLLAEPARSRSCCAAALLLLAGSVAPRAWGRAPAPGAWRGPCCWRAARSDPAARRAPAAGGRAARRAGRDPAAAVCAFLLCLEPRARDRAQPRAPADRAPALPGAGARPVLCG